MLHLSLLLQVTPQLRSLSIPLPLLILHCLLLAMLLYGVCWTLSWLFRQCMNRFWWMCSGSFKLCVLIWRVLDGLLHHLLLMMIHDCPLAILHGGVHIDGDRGSFRVYFFRLYLGASWCIYIYIYIYIIFWLMMWWEGKMSYFYPLMFSLLLLFGA